MRRQTEDRHTLATCREHPTRSRDRVRIPVGVALLVLSALAVVVSLAPAQSADATLEARVKRVGKKLLCLCGCNQILVECNHRNCPFSGPAIATLRQAVQRYESDDLAIQAMIQQYGTAILAAPPAHGFHLTAWITPFAAALGGLVLIVFVLRRWSRHREVSPTEPASIPEDPAWRERVRREIEREVEGRL